MSDTKLTIEERMELQEVKIQAIANGLNAILVDFAKALEAAYACMHMSVCMCMLLSVCSVFFSSLFYTLIHIHTHIHQLSFHHMKRKHMPLEKAVSSVQCTHTHTLQWGIHYG